MSGSARTLPQLKANPEPYKGAAAPSSLRAFAISLIRKHRWFPPLLTLVLTGGLIVVTFWSDSILFVMAAAAAVAASAYISGYSARAFKKIDYPSLLHLPRREYGSVWDALAASPALARRAACGYEDESAVRRSAQVPVRNLIELANIKPDDDILEFGCGVARIGLELAPLCHSWTGADVSSNMLAAAAERLRDTYNTRLVKLQQAGLDLLESNSFDLVYSTNMLPHLDQMDRWRYVKDAFRVLRPGGRLFIDCVDLESEEGWKSFTRDADASQGSERPPYFPTPSTEAELTMYAVRAGFGDARVHRRSPLVILTAVKMV